MIVAWAFLTWFPSQGPVPIHASDVAVFGKGWQGLLVELLGREGEWAVVGFAGLRARVGSCLLTACPAPAFRYGQWVSSIPPRRPVTGAIAHIRWHFAARQPFYLLAVKGRRGKSRYWAHELAPV